MTEAENTGQPTMETEAEESTEAVSLSDGEAKHAIEAMLFAAGSR